MRSLELRLSWDLEFIAMPSCKRPLVRTLDTPGEAHSIGVGCQGDDGCSRELVGCGTADGNGIFRGT